MTVSFSALNTKLLDPKSRVFAFAVRAKRLDEWCAGSFHQPDTVVLDLGAGLDGRMLRVQLTHRRVV